MHKTVETRVNYYLSLIDKAKKTEFDLIKAEEVTQKYNIVGNFWVDHEVNFDFSVKSIDDVKRVLGQFAKEGLLLEKFVPSSTSPAWYLKGTHVAIRLFPLWSTGEEGSICKLIKVGEETHTTTVYKLVYDGKEVDQAINESEVKAEDEPPI